MQTFFWAFHRNDDGSWTCIAPATLDHPGGRLQVTEGTTFAPGSRFMGVDIVAWLEEQLTRLGPPAPRVG